MGISPRIYLPFLPSSFLRPDPAEILSKILLHVDDLGDDMADHITSGTLIRLIAVGEKIPTRMSVRASIAALCRRR